MPTPLQGYVGSLQGNNYSLQGSSPLSLQGNTQQIQGTVQPKTAPKKITYGNTAATSPAKQTYIDSLKAYKYDDDPTVYGNYNGASDYAFHSEDEFKNAGGNFANVETRQRPLQTSAPLNNSQNSMPLNVPTSAPVKSSLDIARQTYLESLKPSDSLSAARTAYLESLNPSADVTNARTKYSDFINNTESGIAGLEGQGRGIPLKIVRGQQGKLAQQAELTANRLQDDVSLAENNSQAIQNRAKTALGFATEDSGIGQNVAKAGLDFATTDASNNKPIELSSGSSLVKYNPTTGKYETVASGPAKTEKRDTSITEVNGQRVIVDTQTGETIANLGSTKSGGSGGSSNNDLAAVVLNNPGLFNQLTPTEKARIAPVLNQMGFTQFGKPLSDAAIKNITDSQIALSSLEDLRQTIKGNESKIGPITGLAALNPYSESRKIQAEIDAVRQRVGKALEGGVLRKEDEEKYKKILATITDTPSTAISKIDQLIKDVSRDIETYSNNQQLAGRNSITNNSTTPSGPAGDPFGIR